MGDFIVQDLAKPERANHLAGQKSPYLLQHAHNPVDWYPWGGEAFEKARKENKPIFLSVGYSTCHWCHVMERESFENRAVAKEMNDHFVNIKVDREERPDVDRVYMAFVQATTGSGGWPMSVWLTPDLKPFVGGTYFPPQDAYGRPGFQSVLARIASAWRNDEKGIRDQAGQITGHLRHFAEGRMDSGEEPNAEMLDRGFEQMEVSFDAKDGGFGRAPKFPRPSELLFLFHEATRLDRNTKAGRRAIEMASFTLEKMARGGIHDQLGGGFHRYSVDGEWHVPHFEKMLYDQAQLAEAYLLGYQITGRTDFAETARDTLDYVLRDMTSPGGGFYSAEDADSAVCAGSREKEEGAFYVWTDEEIRAALGGGAAKAFEYVHGVEPGGNAGEPDGKNILIQRHTAAEAAEKFGLGKDEMRRQLAKSNATLFEVRSRRPPPHRDDKILTAWNGLMITALAKAHQVLGDEKYLAAANRAADFICKNLHNENVLTRAWLDGSSGIHAFAEDYAFLIRGLIDLYESGLDHSRLEWAVALQKQQDALFWDRDAGGYFSSTGNDPSVLLRMKEVTDGAEPSPNAVAALNLLRLDRLLAIPGWCAQARKTLALLAGPMRNSPLVSPTTLIALNYLLLPAAQIVIASRRDAAATRTMLAEVWKLFLPGTVWVLIDDTAREFFAGHSEFYRGVREIDGRPTAYVCRNFTCNLPTADMAIFAKELASLHDPSKSPE